MTLWKGHYSTKRDDTPDNTGQLYFLTRSPSMKFKNSRLIFVLTDRRTDKPKAICPFNFFKVSGITTTLYERWCELRPIDVNVTLVRSNVFAGWTESVFWVNLSASLIFFFCVSAAVILWVARSAFWQWHKFSIKTKKRSLYKCTIEMSVLCFSCLRTAWFAWPF